MKELISAYGSYPLGLITIVVTLVAGNRKSWAWLLGFFNQGLWALWIWATGSWGLLPLTVVLCVIYARNYLRWSGDEERKKAPGAPDRWVVLDKGGWHCYGFKSDCSFGFEKKRELADATRFTSHAAASLFIEMCCIPLHDSMIVQLATSEPSRSRPPGRAS